MPAVQWNKSEERFPANVGPDQSFFQFWFSSACLSPRPCTICMHRKADVITKHPAVGQTTMPHKAVATENNQHPIYQQSSVSNEPVG